MSHARVNLKVNREIDDQDKFGKKELGNLMTALKAFGYEVEFIEVAVTTTFDEYETMTATTSYSYAEPADESGDLEEYFGHDTKETTEW